MTKKIVIGFFIIIACGLLFVVGCGIVLFLAPGTEIFGIRYVASGLSEYSVAEGINNFSGDIYIETDDVPITINYSDYYNTSVSFTQDFVGYTKSKKDVASADIHVNANDNLIIKTHEIKKFFYAKNSEDDFHLTIVLPKATMYGKSIYIKSGTSGLTINGEARFNEFSMVSSGGLTFNSSISATSFKYHTSKAVSIDEKINATDFNLKSTSSNITIKKAISGDLITETDSGDIKFVSCKTLKATTESGEIRGYGEGLPSVAGAVNIKTKGGAVTLGAVSTVDTSAECNITTRSGAIDISNMNDGEINSVRGRIYVGSARKIIINDNIGNVTVNTVTGGIVVNGRNGKVILGNKGIVNNPTVRTTTGAISVKNAAGLVEIESTANNVTFDNESSTKIDLHAGKDLKATGLKGKVDVYANGNCDLIFTEINGDVTVKVGSKSDKVNIDATCISFEDVDYIVKSSKGKKAKVYAGAELLKAASKINSGRNNAYVINVSSSYAKIVLKLGA